jgi:hypothetical protein
MNIFLFQSHHIINLKLFNNFNLKEYLSFKHNAYNYIGTTLQLFKIVGSIKLIIQFYYYIS